MKKLFLIVAVFASFAFASCVVEESCECMFGEPDTCLNSYDLGSGCANDCDFDTVIDCDALCVNAGAYSGQCGNDGFIDDECLCSDK
jgi:hypothetical protein